MRSVRAVACALILVLGACGDDHTTAPSSASTVTTAEEQSTTASAGSSTTSDSTTVEHSTSTSTTEVLPSAERLAPIALSANGLVLLQTGTDWAFPFGDGVVVLDSTSGAQRRLADMGPMRGVGLNRSGLVALNLPAGDTTPCPDVDRPDLLCPVFDAAVWDSTSDEITRLPGWSALLGPNESGLVVVTDAGGFAVWSSATGGIVRLEGLDATTPRNGWVVGINDRGQVVGTDSTRDDITASGDFPTRRIVVWDAASGRVTELGDPTGTPGTGHPHAGGIDDDGRVAAYGPPAFVWDPATRAWSPLPERWEPVMVWAVSSAGMLAGTDQSLPSPPTQVLVWDLARGALVQPGLPPADLGAVIGIDDDGDVLAAGATPTPTALFYDASTHTWSYLETPARSG